MLTGLLMIFLHMAPMTAGMAWSIYQEGGIHVVQPSHQIVNRQMMMSMNANHFSSHAAYLAYIRSQAQKAIFAKAHPCPSTHKPVMSCVGYVIDHVIPLCDSGPDKATNMQWQTTVASYKKDIIERRVCACHKANKTNCNDPWFPNKKVEATWWTKQNN